MLSTPPFVKQQSPDACAIACLRMILAHQGIQTTESELVQTAAMQPGGLDPEEIAQLGNRYGLRAVEQQLEHDALLELIKRKRFPIVVVYRRPIDGVDAGHAVIPVRRSRHHVTFLDPLRGKRRVTIGKFEKARYMAGNWVVVWEPPQ